MRVIVTEEETCEYARRSREKFGNWEERYSYDITGVRIATDDEKTCYGEEGFLVPDGTKRVYVIYMTYNTGDSFGNAYGRGAILGAFGNRNVAEKALKEIEKQKEKYSIEVVDDFGKPIKIGNPGAGYFETVTGIHLSSYDLDDVNLSIKF